MLQLLFDFFGGKAKTRIYSTFLGWILIFHLDILFIAFFTDQAIIYEKTKLLKGEYVWLYVMQFGLWSILAEIGRFLFAIAMTYSMIWVIPKLISEKSYRKELEVEYALRKMKIAKEEALNAQEESVVKQQLENIESEKQVVTERIKLDEAPEHVKWDSDFDAFIQAPNAMDTLDEISHTVYAEGGNLFQYQNASGWAQSPQGVKPDNLALADTNDLVTFSDKGKILSLTKKGKYFIKRVNNGSAPKTVYSGIPF